MKDVKILFLCGFFAKENEEEVLQQARGRIEYSANIFQEKLIHGLQELSVDYNVISAPFIGSYPNSSSWSTFKGFEILQDQCTYVGFNNIWGIRNLSRAKALKRAIKSFIEADIDRKLIIVYSVHTPFLEAAVYAKKRDPNIKICLIVPDLPEYMNLNQKVSLIYKIGKKYDIGKFYKLNEFVDSYMLLTELMREKVSVRDKPYIVVEGIIDSDIFSKTEQLKHRIKKDKNLKYIVYAGGMNQKYGIRELIESFQALPEKNYRLVLCGRGDLDQYVSEKAKKDSRILALGQIAADSARDWMLKADVLVNPRENNEDYTKYSFPSKNIEYLTTGNPVVAYMLSGMPKIYKDFIYTINNKSEILSTIKYAVTDHDHKKYEKFVQYAQNLTGCKIIERIVKLSWCI